MVVFILTSWSNNLLYAPYPSTEKALNPNFIR
jgi:hypothetical protein